jgi:NAD(P) transhydrogenase
MASSTPEHYDLIVIGSGPAGEKGAAQAAYFGKRVALVEKEPHLGGAAVNTGTISSKTLRETALYLSGFRKRELYGLHFSLKQQLHVRELLARERMVKETERELIQENLERHRVRVYQGTASFVDSHTIAVCPARCPELRIHGDIILIATGSYPYRPAVFPFSDPRVYDSDSVLNLHSIPPSLLVVGGGVIGCEYACTFAVLGIKVTLVEKRERLIGSLDAEIAESLRAHMEDLGIQLLFNDSVAEVRDGDDQLTVVLESGATLQTFAILVSSGRCGQIEGLGLERVGIPPRDRGRIPVNEHYQTCVPHVYAAGDVIGAPALASTSIQQARLAMVHAFNLQYLDAMPQILPYGIYTIPECSMVGETEEALIEKKVPYVAGKASYGRNPRGQIVGDLNGFLKLLFNKGDMKLLGVHMIGELATELIHIGLTALLANQGADLFLHTCYNYPTLSDLYKYATYDALGQRAKPQKAEGGGKKTEVRSQKSE